MICSRCKWLGPGGTFLLALLLTAPAGCVSRSKARTKTRQAYVAGQRAAVAQMQQPPPSSGAPVVGIVGPVKNRVLLWRSDLTLAHAVLEADYESPTDPAAIIIHRNGQELSIAPERLLNGEDILLEAGDIVQIQP